MSRAAFQLVQKVPLVDILLDTGNPRIRDGRDQSDCISKILRKEEQLLALMQDIAEKGLTTAPILVKTTGDGRYVVMDGNRRITALKLLHEPNLCPDERVKTKVKLIRQKNIERIAATVDVLASDNDDAISIEVLSRHTGAQGGVGQLDWSAYLRTVYQLNHGHPPEYKRPGQYAMWAERQGIYVDDEFPITSLQRFFSAENLELLGFSIVNDELVVQISPELAKRLAQSVMNDFAVGAVKVDDIRKPEQAKAYILQIRSRAGLDVEPLVPKYDEDHGSVGSPVNSPSPSPSPAPIAPNGGAGLTAEQGPVDNAAPPPVPPRPAPTPRQPPSERKRVFGQSSPNIAIPESETKARQIVAELRMLDVRETPLAVAMLLRHLIEISEEYYRKKHRLADKTKLGKNVLASVTHMRDSARVDAGVFDIVSRIAQPGGTDLLQIETLQKIMHRDTHHPTYQLVNTFWDNIAPFVRACWSS